jgi:hypothetical protein
MATSTTITPAVGMVERAEITVTVRPKSTLS